ncbi:hypothetical protein AJ79_04667 [Helicocarpus griseus UAMH5409]|uniref:Rieske domain-containing protein n=1 Tax=Helicocarpus griseus UAMH5409 TaxID=1447875 RepID=A0A2B7XRB3_9EURO|nr:hypothetical protein AJ79_04667 [Helicocarpus griseus UAMH5409]
MEYLPPVLSTTYILVCIPLILLAALLAVLQKDEVILRRPLLSFGTFNSNIRSFFLKGVTSPEKSTVVKDGAPTESKGLSSLNVWKESDFPDNWWTGDDVFRLERRAIFSKTWLYIAHTSRFRNPGDYHAYEICGFPLFLIQGKDNIIRAFHNVCRHRAYPVISRKKSGSTTVMGCRYHGWSYDTKGHLIKAPQFDSLEAFDKSQNSLFEIRTRVSKDGLIFVNLDAGDEGIAELDVRGIDSFTNRNRITRQFVWIDGWEIEGKFNWKMAVRNLYGDQHSGIGTEIKSSSISSVLHSMFGVSIRDRISSCTLNAFPTTSVHMTGEKGTWYSISVVPMEVNRSIIRCDLYGPPGSKAADGSLALAEDLKSALGSRMVGFETAFKEHALAKRISSEKEPNPEEKCIVHLHDHAAQDLILSKLKAHLKLERVQGEEILPTIRRSTTSDKYKHANELCKELESLSDGAIGSSPPCLTMSKDSLSW